MTDNRGARRYFELKHGRQNKLGSNLTELNGAYNHFVRGFTRHPDWLAHVSRYVHVAEAVSGAMNHKHHGPINVLDVGCGYLNLPIGMHHNRSVPDGYWGLDLRIRESWLEYQHLTWAAPTTLVRADVVLDDPTALPGWPARGFEYVVCFETLEHVPRRSALRLVKNLFYWTRPGGTCFLSTPNAGPSRSIADNHVSADGEKREWSYADKLAMVRKAGFVVDETYGTFMTTANIPPAVLADPTLQAAKKYLPHAWFVALVAAAFPEQANNAIFIMRRPK